MCAFSLLAFNFFPLTDCEKIFIVNWFRFRPINVAICWKTIAFELERNFGIRHSINKIKTFWYANRYYYLDRIAKENGRNRFENILEPHIILEPKFNQPYKMQPLF